jgi:hypothetical protein
VKVSIRSDQLVLPSQQPFDDRTNYRTDYVPHPQQERFQRKREEYIPTSSALYTLITDREDFISKDSTKKKTKFSSFFSTFFSCLN